MKKPLTGTESSLPPHEAPLAGQRTACPKGQRIHEEPRSKTDGQQHRFCQWVSLGGAALFIAGIGAAACSSGGPASTAPAPVASPTRVVPPKASSPGETWTHPTDGAILVYVPEGEFDMGANKEDDPEAYVDEMPKHRVWLDGFWIDRTEVTQGQFDQCVRAGGCGLSAKEWQEQHDQATSNLPVVGVTWEQAKAYCEWAGGHLPTEAQWEKAARGMDGRRYPWGNEAPDGTRLNYCDVRCTASEEWKDSTGDDGHIYVAPVGLFPAGASPYGALDMMGNVEEWIADWYDPEYYQNSPDRNPPGPETPGLYPYIANKGRVVRGGSFLGSPTSFTPTAPDGSVSPFGPVSLLRATARWLQGPEFPSPALGFRCVVSP